MAEDPGADRLARRPTRPDALLQREWLVTNGLGGYASGTVAGVATRRYHGLLIAALPAPLGRMVMLSHLAEQVRCRDGALVRLGGEESAAGLDAPRRRAPREFRLEAGLPVWSYERPGCVDREAAASAARCRTRSTSLPPARGRRPACG